MSFILDALKKSESDRQQQGSAEFTGVPTSSGRSEGPPAWLWIVGALLVINIAVLISIFMKPAPDVAPAEIAAAEPTAAELSSETTSPVEDDFAGQVAEARQNAPRREEPPAAQPRSVRTPDVVVASEPVVNTAILPSIHELRANGTLTLPDLHVDIHVYSASAEDRFVFINMARHNEGSRLAEGPLVEEITPDGVVLSMNGVTFLLPRD